MIEIIQNPHLHLPNILVIGIGGAGGNAVSRMYSHHTSENFPHAIQYAVINTDLQVLSATPVPTSLQIGSKLTQGFGAGADAAIGEAAALESADEISELISNTNMVILTCGLGGGTGSGAIPVVADLCKEKGILTVAVVTTPFTFESRPRTVTAQSSLEKLKNNVDTLLVIPNDKLLSLPGTMKGKSFCLEDAFNIADGVLKDTVFSITNIIYNCGMINLDFNDLCSVLRNKGQGHIGIGYSDESTPLTEALQQAIQSPLLDTSISGATNILLNTSGRVDLSELSEAVEQLRHLAGESVNIIWGTVANNDAESDQVVITLIATGMDLSLPKSATQIPVIKSSSTENRSKTAHTKQLTLPINFDTPEIRPLLSSTKNTTNSSAPKQITPTIPRPFKIPSFLDRNIKQ